MIGGLLATLGLVLTAFSTEYYQLFIFFVAIHGLGRALSYAPSLIAVNMYFDKHRSLAAGLGSSGAGVGIFALIPLMQFVFDNYDFTGSFLILSGVALHWSLTAMLYRPLSMHQRFIRTSKDNEVKDIDNDDLFKDLPSKTIVSTHISQQSSQYTTKNNNDSCCKSSFDILFPIENQSSNKNSKKKIFDFGLLKDPSFFCYCLSICLYTMAFRSAFTFFPALMKTRGISEPRAALVLAIVGISDTAGRVLAGFLMDLPALRLVRAALYNSCMFLVSATSFIIPSLQTYWSFVLITCVYTLFTGAYVSQKSVVIVDILGVANMSNSFGLLIVFQGLGTLMGPPLSGAFKDHFGSYDEAFYLGGGCMVVAGFMMILSNIFLKLKTKRREIHGSQVMT